MPSGFFHLGYTKSKRRISNDSNLYYQDQLSLFDIDWISSFYEALNIQWVHNQKQEWGKTK